MPELDEIIGALTELSEDFSIPKNVKIKIGTIITSLKQKSELSLKINKALDLLEEISDDNNIDSYIRTRLFNVASLLESLN